MYACPTLLVTQGMGVNDRHTVFVSAKSCQNLSRADGNMKQNALCAATRCGLVLVLHQACAHFAEL